MNGNLGSMNIFNFLLFKYYVSAYSQIEVLKEHIWVEL